VKKSTCVFIFFCVTTLAAIQPDPRQMSGMPLPDQGLPDGTISVRVIRGSLSNNVLGHPVDLRQGDIVETALTDAEGRATFLTLNPGQRVQASTELDGETIESQFFAVPGRGGIRVMLVGVDPENPPLPAKRGQVSFGGESFIQIELVEESVEVYYVFEVLNIEDSPVETETIVAFDLPSGSQGVTVLPGSSPRTVTDGPRIELAGPFDPGVTPLRIAFILPYSGDSLSLSQIFPVDMESMLFSIEDWPQLDFTSSQIERRMEVPSEVPGGVDYVIGVGPRLLAGREFSVELVGLPHRSTIGRSVALIAAFFILGVGVWLSLVGPHGVPEAEDRRQVLLARRTHLFSELVKIEKQYQNSKIGSTKYSTRRSELFSSIEKIYRVLDQDEMPDFLSIDQLPANQS
tara:strand:- start:7406 stop:8614 length:1209 start_codon:yes stop_codon:yes gene_type:complete